MTSYDMSPLDSSQKIEIKINIFNETNRIDSTKIFPLSTNGNVSDLKTEIAEMFNIPQSSQAKLSLINKNNQNKTETTVLSDDTLKLSSMKLSPSSIIKLEIDDTCKWSPDLVQIGSQIQNQNQNEEKPTKGNVKVKQKDVLIEMDDVKQKAVESQKKRKQRQRQNVVQVREPMPFNNAEYEHINSLIKQSKTHCRVLLLIFEIVLILAIVYWGQLVMIQYGVTMVFCLIAWRGCRKLIPVFMLCFLLYLVFDILVIFTFIIVGLIEGHTGRFSSPAVYILLLLFEVVLECFWLYFYTRFFFDVIKTPIPTRIKAAHKASKQAILI